MPARKTDNQTGRLWVEPGQEKTGPVARVAPIAPIDKEYAFAVPDGLADRLSPGQRVRVPLGRTGRVVEGFCTGVHVAPWESTLRYVDSLVDARSFLTDELLELGRWIARHYACPLGRTLNALVPRAVRAQAGFQTVRHARLQTTPDAIQHQARQLGRRQRAIIDALAAADEPVNVTDLLRATGASSATLRALVQRDWVAVDAVKEPPTAPNFDRPAREPDFALNADQAAALARVHEILDAGAFRVALVYGVSGSGKTEVYIHAIRRVIEAGRQAIFLVPEIALTTQLVSRLAARFADVAVIHSGLTGVARSLTWEAIANRQKRVIIGTRSAVFAPCPDPGLIVVDEEQESSYKNLQAPRFHVRDVAIKRAQNASIPVVLGSATPSLESWVNAQRAEHYERIDLPRRVRSLPLPRVHVVDMRDEYRAHGRFALLSRLMEEKLTVTLDRGEQAVLLINRRGYASMLFCPNCKLRLECPDCHAPLVFHSAVDQALCHYCRHRLAVPTICPNPSCGTPLVAFGAGTQRVEQVLKKRYPNARVHRVDSDTMRSEDRYRRVIDEFETRRIDVVVGTQMIAKGLDFPFVSFVGVLQADIATAAPDFRASERLFQLITQVAGRAGRADVPGEVVVQTMAPETPAIQAAVDHDFRRFAEDELQLRHRLRYPPFARLARVLLADARESVAREESERLADRIRNTIEAVAPETTDVLGPQPCAIERLRGRYRYDLLIRSETAIRLQQLLDRLRADKLLKAKVQSMVVDVDPSALT